MCVTLLLEAILIFHPLLLALYRREKQYQELLGKMEDEILERVRFQTFNDPLTGLPNRLAIFEKIQTIIQMSRGSSDIFVVISVGIDRLRDINNSMGHDYGDTLLVDIAARLNTLASQSGGFAGRMTGDEFSIVLEQRRNDQELMGFVSQLLAVVNFPLKNYDHNVKITASLGLALYPEDGLDARTLLMHATQAMHTARSDGGNCLRFFQPAMTSKMTRRIYLEHQLRQALASQQSQLSLYYQPKVELKTGVITGVEALLRWNHPEEGPIGPDEFIPVAEESDLIQELGDWVLVTALQQTAEWQKQGLRLSVNINVSVRQLLRANISRRVISLARQLNIDPSHIQLEITESNVMDHMDRIISQLNELVHQGFVLAIDDFGTGHSSLARLRDLPAGVLKIDKSFVSSAMLDNRDMQVVKAIIEMGHLLGKCIIAEGVETPEQMAMLRRLGCEEGQGYLFSKPLPATQITPLLDNKRISPDYLPVKALSGSC